MGCGNSNEKEYQNNSRHIDNKIYSSCQRPLQPVAKKTVIPNKNKILKEKLRNIQMESYNESALKITKYWKNQMSPSKDYNSQFIDDLFPPNNNSVFGKDKNGNF